MFSVKGSQRRRRPAGGPARIPDSKPAIDRRRNAPIHPSTDALVDRLIRQSINESTNQPIKSSNQLVNHPNNPSATRWAGRSVCRPTGQSTGTFGRPNSISQSPAGPPTRLAARARAACPGQRSREPDGSITRRCEKSMHRSVDSSIDRRVVVPIGPCPVLWINSPAHSAPSNRLPGYPLAGALGPAAQLG